MQDQNISRVEALKYQLRKNYGDQYASEISQSSNQTNKFQAEYDVEKKSKFFNKFKNPKQSVFLYNINKVSDLSPTYYQDRRAQDTLDEAQGSSFQKSDQVRQSNQSKEEGSYYTTLSNHYRFIKDPLRQGELVDTTINHIEPVESDWQSIDMIPTLKNNLDVVLQKPGIYPLRQLAKSDPNLVKYFNRLPAYSQINEECIAPYYPPGTDKNLARMAANNNCNYMMSTSTVSSVLTHIYYSISNHKSPHFDNLSEAFDREALKFMITQRKPNTIFLREVDKKKGLFSIDGDSGFIEANNVVLLKMGKYVEKMLTTDMKYFNDHYVLDMKTNKPMVPLSQEQKDELAQEDYFRYMKSGKMFLRSQIDTRGTDIDGNEIVFELKTRATAVIRYDINNYIDYLDYEVKNYRGSTQTYEREFYDLIRGGFLKYIMQMKIGRMQGAAIAYHNTQKIFGFEYVKLEEMEKRVFGNTHFADIIFRSGITILEKILDFLIEDLYDRTCTSEEKKVFKIGFYASNRANKLVLMVEMFEDEQIYQERIKEILPEYMKHPVDYYLAHNIKPQVIRYDVQIDSIHNGILLEESPIMFEEGDSFKIKLGIQRVGHVGFNEYMQYLHEAYKLEQLNIINEFSGTWSFQV